MFSVLTLTCDPWMHVIRGACVFQEFFEVFILLDGYQWTIDGKIEKWRGPPVESPGYHLKDPFNRRLTPLRHDFNFSDSFSFKKMSLLSNYTNIMLII